MAIVFINIFVYILEATLFWYYCENAFGGKHSKPVNYGLVFAVFSFGCVMCCVFNHSTYINLVVGLLSDIFIIWVIYKQKILIASIHSIIIFTLLGASEYILIPLCSLIFGPRYQNGVENVTFYFFIAIVGKLLHMFTVIIVLHIYLKFISKKQKNNTDSTKGLLISLVIPFSSTVLFVLLEDSFVGKPLSVKEYVIWAVAAVLLLISTLFVFYYRSYLISLSRKITGLELKEQQKQFDEQYYALVEKSNRDMQILSHDFKNHLIQLDTAENMEQVHEYIKSMYPTIQQFHSVNVSENKTLNTIISKYNSLCAVKGIEFKYNISASLSFLENNDLTAILGNLLDNALESAEKCAKKRIALSIYSKNEKTTVLRITNTCESAPVVKKGKLQTTKTDDAPHGLGLKSVESTVKKYGGFYEWEYSAENREFETLISFYH